MKVVKFLLKAVVAIVALAVVALLALPLWFGPVAKTAANALVPGIVKTDFHMGHVALNPYSGRFELADTQLSNPQGYSEKYAVTLGDIAFDCEPLSLATDVIHIEEIKVKDVFVSVVTRDGVMNFTQIQYNVAGGKEKCEAAQQQKEQQKEGEMPAEESAQKDEAPAKKVIIDRLEISGLKLQLGILPISLPSITLTDIGRKEGGATLADAWQQIVDGVLGAAGAVGDQAKALMGSVGDVSKQATEALGNVRGDGAKAIGDGAKAVGEGAKKALDSLKSLW